MNNKLIVIKIGGEVAESEETSKSLLKDLISLKNEGYKVVLCHGGGPQITRELKKRGVETKFINGQRVTDTETLKLTCQILLGDINSSLVSQCNCLQNVAVGVSGLDAMLYSAELKEEALGYVGKIMKINSGYIQNLLAGGLIPVVASIGMGEDGQVYNINADSAAGGLAAALLADYFLVFTNVDGLYKNFADKDSLVKKTNLKGLKQFMSSGSLSEGMIPKIESVITALEGGVGSAVIVDGRNAHAVLNTVKGLESSSQIFGTVVTRESD